MMCNGARVRDTRPGTSSMPPPIAASEAFGDEIDLTAFELPVGADVRIAFQKFR